MFPAALFSLGPMAWLQEEQTGNSLDNKAHWFLTCGRKARNWCKIQASQATYCAAGGLRDGDTRQCGNPAASSSVRQHCLPPSPSPTPSRSEMRKEATLGPMGGTAPPATNPGSTSTPASVCVVSTLRTESSRSERQSLCVLLHYSPRLNVLLEGDGPQGHAPNEGIQNPSPSAQVTENSASLWVAYNDPSSPIKTAPGNS